MQPDHGQRGCTYRAARTNVRLQWIVYGKGPVGRWFLRDYSLIRLASWTEARFTVPHPSAAQLSFAVLTVASFFPKSDSHQSVTFNKATWLYWKCARSEHLVNTKCHTSIRQMMFEACTTCGLGYVSQTIVVCIPFKVKGNDLFLKGPFCHAGWVWSMWLLGVHLYDTRNGVCPPYIMDMWFSCFVQDFPNVGVGTKKYPIVFWVISEMSACVRLHLLAQVNCQKQLHKG